MRVAGQCLPPIARARGSIVHPPNLAGHAQLYLRRQTSEAWDRWRGISEEVWKKAGRVFFRYDSALIGGTPLSMRGSHPQRPALVQLCAIFCMPEHYKPGVLPQFENQRKSPDGPARGTAIVNGASLVGLRMVPI